MTDPHIKFGLSVDTDRSTCARKVGRVLLTEREQGRLPRLSPNGRRKRGLKVTWGFTVDETKVGGREDFHAGRAEGGVGGRGLKTRQQQTIKK